MACYLAKLANSVTCVSLFPGSWEKPFSIPFQKEWCRFSKSAVICFLLAGFCEGSIRGGRRSSPVSAGQEQICWLHSAWPGGSPPDAAAVTSKRLSISIPWIGEVKSQQWLCGLAQANLQADCCPLHYTQFVISNRNSGLGFFHAACLSVELSHHAAPRIVSLQEHGPCTSTSVGALRRTPLVLPVALGLNL